MADDPKAAITSLLRTALSREKNEGRVSKVEAAHVWAGGGGRNGSTNEKKRIGDGTEGGAYSFAACQSHLTIDRAPLEAKHSAGGWGWGRTYLLLASSLLTIDHASLSRRGTVPTPNRDTSNIWACNGLHPYTAHKLSAFLNPSVVRRLWPPSISQEPSGGRGNGGWRLEHERTILNKKRIRVTWART